MTVIFPIKGIIEQLKSESKAAKIKNLDWTIRSFGTFSNEAEIFIKQTGKYKGLLSFRRDYYKWLNDEIANNNYDIVLLRYQPFDIGQFLFVLRNRKRVKIYLVLHTLAIQEILSGNKLISYVKAFSEMLVAPLTFNLVHGLICVTDEIGKKEKKRALVLKSLKQLLYPNGILYSNDTNMQVEDRRDGDIPILLFVASSFAPWHGLDLLIDSIRCSKSKFILYIVGNVPYQYLTGLTDSRIKQFGTLSSSKIRELTAESWVGLSSFGHFRLNMKQASTLKVREYLAYGLPVYATYKECFPEDFPYFRNGPCDIDQIVLFAKSMKIVSRESVSNLSKPFIDKPTLLNRLFEQL
jgi:glycosyltransferase involved in cell wall biosynthesis